jgi:hypothetical protein
MLNDIVEILDDIYNDALEGYEIRDIYDDIRREESAIMDTIDLIKQELRKKGYKC